MGMITVHSARKFSGTIWLPVILCVLILWQTLAASHVHSSDLDAVEQSECTLCFHASQNDDYDLPSQTNISFIAAPAASLAETHAQQPFAVPIKARARAPPFS